MENKNLPSIKEYLDRDEVKTRVGQLLKSKADTFMVSLLSVVSNNKSLLECTPTSVLNAAMTAASLDLPVNQNLGYAYIIPFKDKGVSKAQLQIGTKGFVQLAQRSGQLKTINVTEVREGELKGTNRASGEMEFEWIEDEKERSAKPIIGYLAFMKLINGFEKSLYMSSDQLTKHGARFSQTFKMGFGLWKDDFDSMAKKTVIKLLLSRYAPLSVAMQRAQLADQAIIEAEDDFRYVDNEKETPEEIASTKERERVEKHIAGAKTIADLLMVKDHLVGDDLNNKYNEKMEILKLAQ
jgi:recombination protein RecT